MLQPMLHHILVLTLVGGAATPAPFHDEAARRHFEAAQEQFELREYRAAAQSLEAAHAIEQNAQILYPWAQAERLDGNCKRAVQLYAEFLATDPPGDHARLAQENIATCEKILQRDRKHAPTPAGASAPDGRAQAGADKATGRPWRRDVAAAVLVGVGSGLVGISTGLMVGAAATAASTRKAEDVEDYQRRFDRATLQRNVALGGFAVGGALVIAGVVRYAVLARSQRQPRVGAWVSPQAVSVVVRGRFGRLTTR